MRDRCNEMRYDVLTDNVRGNPTITVDLNDFTTVLTLALRYSFTRRSGIGHTVASIISKYGDEIPQYTIDAMCDDVMQRIADTTNKDEEFWLDILDKLRSL